MVTTHLVTEPELGVLPGLAEGFPVEEDVGGGARRGARLQAQAQHMSDHTHRDPEWRRHDLCLAILQFKKFKFSGFPSSGLVLPVLTRQCNCDEDCAVLSNVVQSQCRLYADFIHLSCWVGLKQRSMRSLTFLSSSCRQHQEAEHAHIRERLQAYQQMGHMEEQRQQWLHAEEQALACHHAAELEQQNLHHMQVQPHQQQQQTQQVRQGTLGMQVSTASQLKTSQILIAEKHML